MVCADEQMQLNVDATKIDHQQDNATRRLVLKIGRMCYGGKRRDPAETTLA